MPRVGVAMAVYRVMRYCYSFLICFSDIFQLYILSSILWYGYKYHVTLVSCTSSQSQPIRLIFFGCALFQC